jgi:hypothetical protein
MTAWIPTTLREPVSSRARLCAGLASGVLATVMMVAAAVGAAAQAQATPAPSTDVKDYSAAERLLLMSPQFNRVKPPSTLGYRFRKSGSLEEGFEDRVSIQLQRIKGGGCCKAQGDFLSGARKVSLPEVEQAEGNPVTLYFLEHDIRDMNQRTKGSANYFRKRIRMALYQGASVSDVNVTYRGRSVPAREIRLEPYQDDPNRARFERFIGKQYSFVLSDEVPGTVVAIRTRVPGEAGAAASLIEEELLLDGAEVPSSAVSAASR